MDNALKFALAGGTVGIRLSQGALGYEVCIADNGPGIAQNMMEKVFEPFFQVDASPTRRFGGVGIGLAIAREVARGLGGDLTIKSPAAESIAGQAFRGLACYFKIAERAPNASEGPA
jgi:signal transduction histidine kinase